MGKGLINLLGLWCKSLLLRQILGPRLWIRGCRILVAAAFVASRHLFEARRRRTVRCNGLGASTAWLARDHALQGCAGRLHNSCQYKNKHHDSKGGLHFRVTIYKLQPDLAVTQVTDACAFL